MSVWQVCGNVANNFTQAADKTAALSIDTAALAAAYPTAQIEMVGLDQWVERDERGNDGRYVNQWRMVERCWRLMERCMAAAGSRAEATGPGSHVTRCSQNGGRINDRRQVASMDGPQGGRARCLESATPLLRQ